MSAMGTWKSQVELCNRRFVASDFYSIEWINGSLELFIKHGRNNFLIPSTKTSSTNGFYFTAFVNIKLISKGRKERYRDIHSILLGKWHYYRKIPVATFILGNFLFLFVVVLFFFKYITFRPVLRSL